MNCLGIQTYHAFFTGRMKHKYSQSYGIYKKWPKMGRWPKMGTPPSYEYNPDMDFDIRLDGESSRSHTPQL